METNSKNGKESIYLVASAPDQKISTPCILYSACSTYVYIDIQTQSTEELFCDLEGTVPLLANIFFANW